jgi:hypothetical protein
MLTEAKIARRLVCLAQGGIRPEVPYADGCARGHKCGTVKETTGRGHGVRSGLSLKADEDGDQPKEYD